MLTIDAVNAISEAVSASTDDILKATAVKYLKLRIHTMPNPESLISEQTAAKVVTLVEKELNKRAAYQAAITTLNAED